MAWNEYIGSVTAQEFVPRQQKCNIQPDTASIFLVQADVTRCWRMIHLRVCANSTEQKSLIVVSSPHIRMGFTLVSLVRKNVPDNTRHNVLVSVVCSSCSEMELLAPSRIDFA